MVKIQYEHYQELLPAENYIADIEEENVFEKLCAKYIDETQYKDISDEKAEEIINKQNQEVEDNGKEEN